jgi:hypothetical protein
MNSSFGNKTIALLLILALAAGIGMAIASLLLKTNGYQIADIQELMSGQSDFSNMNLLRTILGISHFFTFLFSSMYFAFVFYRNKMFDYFQINRTFSVSDLFKFILLLIMCYPLMGVFVYGLEQLSLPDWADSSDASNKEILTQLLNMENPFDLCLTFLVVAILPGIGEELLFRGIIQNELQRKLIHHSIWPFIIAAFIFAAFHGEVVGFMPKFIIGLILGYAYYKTKNLFIPICLHVLNNGMQVLSVYALGIERSTGEEDFNLTTAQLVFSFLTLPFIMYIIHIIEKRSHGPNS